LREAPEGEQAPLVAPSTATTDAIERPLERATNESEPDVEPEPSPTPPSEPPAAGKTARSRPATADVGKPRGALGLKQETAILRERGAALAAGDPARALAACDRHAREFPHGQL